MKNRYYDKVTTPQDEKTFLEDGENRIIETDETVAIWFAPVDLVKYDRIFDVDGYPDLKEYELQQDGTRYSDYLSTPDEETSVYMKDTVAIASKAILTHNADIQTQIEEEEDIVEGRLTRELTFGTEEEKIQAAMIIGICHDNIIELRGQRQ